MKETAYYRIPADRDESGNVATTHTKELEVQGITRPVRRLIHVQLIKSASGSLLSACITSSVPLNERACADLRLLMECERCSMSEYARAEEEAIAFLNKYTLQPIPSLPL